LDKLKVKGAKYISRVLAFITSIEYPVHSYSPGASLTHPMGWEEEYLLQATMEVFTPHACAGAEVDIVNIIPCVFYLID